MTQIASGPRGHQVDLYEHAQRRTMQLVDPVPPTCVPEGVSLLASLAERATAPAAACPQPEPAQDLLSAVWRTSSYVESVEWELDSAQGQLLQALRQAAAAGLPHEELRKAANMTAPELAAVLATDSLASGPLSDDSLVGDSLAGDFLTGDPLANGLQSDGARQPDGARSGSAVA